MCSDRDRSVRLRRWIGALTVFAVALAVRLVFLVQFSHTPFADFGVSGLDESFYDQWAMSIARGDWVGHDVFYGMPLYPYCLGILYALFGHHILLVKLAQALTGAATCVLVYFIGKKAFNEAVEVIAGLILAFYGVAVMYENLLIGSSLTMLLNAGALLLLMHAVDSRGYHLWVAAGVVLGLSALCMASALLLLPLAAVWAFVCLRSRHGEPRFRSALLDRRWRRAFSSWPRSEPCPR